MQSDQCLFGEGVLPSFWAGNLRTDPWERVELPCARPQWRPWAPAEPAGSPVVSEEQFDLLPTVDLRQEMPPPRVSKSFLSTGQTSPETL